MTKDLTQGKITPLLVKFTIPLLFGNIFQLMYNSVDSIIVGQLVGKEALAAVGTSNPLMTLAILFVNGMCIGASILMGTQYGAKKMDVLKRQISTTMIAGIVFSIAVTLFCILFARPLLLLIRVQEEVLPLAVSYLRIVFLGFIFTFIYNFFACTLRALGDSTTPLYFLVASSVLNIIGDLFFVAVLRWGSMGCAVATVVSEAVCCMLCIIYIKRKVPELNLGKAWFAFDGTLLKQTILYGWTSAMQQGTVQLGKIGVQAIANTMGVSVMAAYTIVNRIDDFACLPGTEYCALYDVFYGAEQRSRKKGTCAKGILGRYEDRTGLWNGHFSGVLLFCRAGCAFVRQRHRCCKRGRHLSETDLIYVSAPGSYEWHTGIFPGNRRSEDHAHQQYGKYGRACARSICFCVWFCNEGRDIPVCVSGRMDCHADYGSASFSAQLRAPEARRECCDLEGYTRYWT